jgi:hypothetical protein
MDADRCCRAFAVACLLRCRWSAAFLLAAISRLGLPLCRPTARLLCCVYEIAIGFDRFLAWTLGASDEEQSIAGLL